MLTDRASAYRQWDLPLDEALREEGRRGAPIVAKEGAAGAQKVRRRRGTRGKFFGLEHRSIYWNRPHPNPLP